MKPALYGLSGMDELARGWKEMRANQALLEERARSDANSALRNEAAAALAR